MLNHASTCLATQDTQEGFAGSYFLSMCTLDIQRMHEAHYLSSQFAVGILLISLRTRVYMVEVLSSMARFTSSTCCYAAFQAVSRWLQRRRSRNTYCAHRQYWSITLLIGFREVPAHARPRPPRAQTSFVLFGRMVHHESPCTGSCPVHDRRRRGARAHHRAEPGAARGGNPLPHSRHRNGSCRTGIEERHVR